MWIDVCVNEVQWYIMIIKIILCEMISNVNWYLCQWNPIIYHECSFSIFLKHTTLVIFEIVLF